MTVATTINKELFNGDGVQLIFPFTFKIFNTSDLRVFVDNVLQTEITNYTVTIAVAPAVGGNVTFLVPAPPTGVKNVVVRRDIPETQEVDLVGNNPQPSESIEEQMDRAVMMIQELQETIERSIPLQESTPTDPSAMAFPEPLADGFIRWKSDLSDLEAVPASTIDPSLVVITPYIETFLDDADAASARDTLLIPRKNRLGNSVFRYAQRGTLINSTGVFFNGDDRVALDLWLHLSDGPDVDDISRVTDAPTGSTHALKAVVQTINKKFGFVQIIENRNCQDIVGGRASLSFQAKTTSGKVINNIRVGVLSWDSAADVLTSDVVSAWNASGANPTLVANWTFENTPVNIALTVSYQKFTIPNISIDTANTKNIAVFIWVDDTDAASGDELFLGEIQFEKGSVVTDFERINAQDDLQDCLWVFQKSFDVDVKPATAAGGGGSVRSLGGDGGSGRLAHYVNLTTRMRKVPTLVGYNTAENSTKWRNLTDGTNHSGEISFAEIGDGGFSLFNGADDATAVNDMCAAHWTAEAIL